MDNDQRSGDRRTGQPGYEGEERRAAERRAAETPGTDTRPPADMSDDDLLQAARLAGAIGQSRAEQIRAEMRRRNLQG